MTSDVEYLEGTNHLVIVANHLHILPDSNIPVFLEKTANLQGMKIEGKDIPSSAPFNCIEVIARAAMVGKPCEWIADKTPDGKQIGTLLEEYGLPTKVSEIYLGFKPLYLNEMKPIRSSEEMANGVYVAITTSKDRFPDLNVNRALTNYERVMQDLILTGQVQLSEIIDFCNVHALYKGPIIQYSFMAPDIEEFRKRINGKIGIVVGSFHAKPIHDMLEGIPMPPPVSWADYKKTLPARSAQVIDSIERIVLDYKD